MNFNVYFLMFIIISMYQIETGSIHSAYDDDDDDDELLFQNDWPTKCAKRKMWKRFTGVVNLPHISMAIRFDSYI